MAGQTSTRTAVALTILRIVIGAVFMMHGYQKWFVMGIPGVTGFFTSVGAPVPAVSAYVVATVELVGGALLILGAFTRLVAIPLIIDMAMAIILVHAKNGFFLPTGVEFVGTLMTGALVLAIAGGGTASVDKMIGRS
jgi:putative oxidoreductase